MAVRTLWSGMLWLFLLLNGCAFVNVEMLRPPSPLQERVVEERGHVRYFSWT